MKIKKLKVFLCTAICAALLTGCGERRETSLANAPNENISSAVSESTESGISSDASSAVTSENSAPTGTGSSATSSDGSSAESSDGSSAGSSNDTSTGGSGESGDAVSSSTTTSEKSSSTTQSTPQPDAEISSNAHQHQYELIRSAAPTCLEVGYELYKCGCGDQYTNTTAEALGHSYTKSVVSPTCTNSGYTTYTCTRCGQSHKDDITAAAGHKYTSTTVKATCTQKGYTLNTCSRCGSEYTSDSTSALGHSWSDWYVYKNATTSSEGEKRAECSRCGEIGTESIPRLKADNSTYASEVVRLVNIEREKVGLSPLSIRNDLTEYAQLRSTEIVSNFAHSRPDGSNPLDYVMGISGIYAAGENIAYGQKSPEAVVTAWMNSQGHRENILKSRYTSIGVGCYEYNGTLYWTQIFAG